MASRCWSLATATAAYRENPRCSQGTGNFLRQLVERFGLAPEEADVLAAPVTDPAPLSGRCPVILKTDMTHLANQGEDRARILAGLFDAICDNVQVLLRARPGADAATVVLAGGVGRSRRVRERFGQRLAERGMTLAEEDGDDALFLDALGCAVLAARGSAPLPPPDELVAPPRMPPSSCVRRSPRRSIASAVSPRVLRRRCPPATRSSSGSTSARPARRPSRCTHPRARRSGRATRGPPETRSRLRRSSCAAPPAGRPVAPSWASASPAAAARSSSRSSTCYGERVHVLNEIAAHAEGARACDPRVDTIFEIGGQDAKYIRLAAGRVVDAAMNEACSAGTGSFIEEQGLRLGNLDVEALARVALGADACAALGQHCAVFMAEILDEAAAAGVTRPRLVAGLYDSVVQNYLNRVKGSRSVGEVVFCQGCRSPPTRSRRRWPGRPGRR